MSATIPQFAKGFTEDATKIIYTYKNTTDGSFKSFSDLWKEMNFGQIFTGRRTAAEVMEISEDFLDIAKYFTIYIDDHKAKIGGLFLLYSLYYSQPMKEFAKIRLMYKEWFTVKNWWLKLDKNIDDEPIYIFAKLYYDNAFKFVFGNQPYGLEKCYNKYYKEFPVTVMMPYYIVEETFSMNPQQKSEMKQLVDNVVSIGHKYKELRNKLNFTNLQLDSDLPNLLNSINNESYDNVKKPSTSGTSENAADANKTLGLRKQEIGENEFGYAKTSERNLDNMSDQSDSSSEKCNLIDDEEEDEDDDNDDNDD